MQVKYLEDITSEDMTIYRCNRVMEDIENKLGNYDMTDAALCLHDLLNICITKNLTTVKKMKKIDKIVRPNTYKKEREILDIE